MSTRSETLTLDDEQATTALGARIAGALGTPPLVIFLSGELGAGKTTLARGILRGLDYAGKVVSPTYTLLEPYEISGRTILHIDLYRIADPGELEYLGLDDHLANSVLLVEWPEKGQGWLPQPDLIIRLEHDANGRTAKLEALSTSGAAISKQAAQA